MAANIPYDARPAALFAPGRANDFFTFGDYTEPALLCAEMSRLAYCGRAGNIDGRLVSAFLARANLELVEFVDQLGQQVLIAAGTDRLIVAFRGTEATDLRDLWADIRFWPGDWRIDGQIAGRVHRGFAQALSAVWEPVRARVQTDPRPALLTGHSLGAAMATLAASRLQPVGLYTFGSPRVGDADFSRWLGPVPHARFVGCRDLVTRLPPPVLGFRHTGACHYITHGGGMVIEPDEATIATDRRLAVPAFRRLRRQQPGALPVRDLSDHAPINYVSAVARWCA